MTESETDRLRYSFHKLPKCHMCHKTKKMLGNDCCLICGYWACNDCIDFREQPGSVFWIKDGYCIRPTKTEIDEYLVAQKVRQNKRLGFISLNLSTNK